MGRSDEFNAGVHHVTTWHGAPAEIVSIDGRTAVHLPEGHEEYGYAPGSKFYDDGHRTYKGHLDAPDHDAPYRDEETKR